jgi:hypothetical protein
VHRKALFDSNIFCEAAILPMKVYAVVFAVAGILCWLFPGAIGGLLFNALQVSASESMVIGAVFLAGAAILLFIESPGDKRL